jgi:hypothetical protein
MDIDLRMCYEIDRRKPSLPSSGGEGEEEEIYSKRCPREKEPYFFGIKRKT